VKTNQLDFVSVDCLSCDVMDYTTRDLQIMVQYNKQCCQGDKLTAMQCLGLITDSKLAVLYALSVFVKF